MDQSLVNQSSWIDAARRDLHWVSVFLRASIGSLLLSAGILKLPGGVSGTVAYYSSLFSQSLLPAVLVRAHASLILFVELALGAWLLSGYRLALGWKVAAALLTSLAVGMLFAGKYDVASDNYLYVLLSLGGLLVSRFDRWVLGARAAGNTRPDGIVSAERHATPS
jgi:methylamine utilization protein MauE